MGGILQCLQSNVADKYSIVEVAKHLHVCKLGGVPVSNGVPSLCPSQAVDVMLEAVYELNACVPYSGISATARLDESAVACVLALLPPALSPGMSSAPNLSEEESKQVSAKREAVLQLIWYCRILQSFWILEVSNHSSLLRPKEQTRSSRR